MDRLNICPIFKHHDKNREIVGIAYHKSLDGEWVKAEEALQIKAKLDALRVENDRLRDENLTMKAKIGLSIALIEGVRNVSHVIYPEDSKIILERLKE